MLGRSWEDVGSNLLSVGAGALDGFSGGLSSALLSALDPGYDCFIKKYDKAFQVGSVGEQVIEAAILMAGAVATFGAGAPVALAWAAGKVSLRAGLKIAATSVKQLARATIVSLTRYSAKIMDNLAGTVSRDVKRLAEQNTTGSGITVLGHFPQYIEKAQAMGASYFDIGDAWTTLSNAQRWAANSHFLDTRFAAADTIVLSVARSKIRPGSILVREIEYMTTRGYSWVDEWTLAFGAVK